MMIPLLLLGIPALFARARECGDRRGALGAREARSLIFPIRSKLVRVPPETLQAPEAFALDCGLTSSVLVWSFQRNQRSREAIAGSAESRARYNTTRPDCPAAVDEILSIEGVWRNGCQAS
jgi:hypothetical protein